MDHKQRECCLIDHSISSRSTVKCSTLRRGVTVLSQVHVLISKIKLWVWGNYGLGRSAKCEGPPTWQSMEQHGVQDLFWIKRLHSLRFCHVSIPHMPRNKDQSHFYKIVISLLNPPHTKMYNPIYKRTKLNKYVNHDWTFGYKSRVNQAAISTTTISDEQGL